MPHSPQAKLRVYFDSAKRQKKKAIQVSVCTYFGRHAAEIASFASKTSPRDSNPRPNATFAAGELKSQIDSAKRQKKKSHSSTGAPSGIRTRDPMRHSPIGRN